MPRRNSKNLKQIKLEKKKIKMKRKQSVSTKKKNVKPKQKENISSLIIEHHPVIKMLEECQQKYKIKYKVIGEPILIKIKEHFHYDDAILIYSLKDAKKYDLNFAYDLMENYGNEEIFINYKLFKFLKYPEEANAVSFYSMFMNVIGKEKAICVYCRETLNFKKEKILGCPKCSCKCHYDCMKEFLKYEYVRKKGFFCPACRHKIL